MLFNKAEYIETDAGNKVSRKATILGAQNIVIAGKTIVQPGAILRGDLRRAGTGAVVVIAIGKFGVIGENAVVRPSYKTYKGAFSYYPMKIGDCCYIGDGTVLEAAQVGNNVIIGKNCVIGRFSVIKDCVRIEDNTILPPGTVVPAMTVFAGSPGKPVGDLPETSPEAFEAASMQFYADFRPAS